MALANSLISLAFSHEPMAFSTSAFMLSGNSLISSFPIYMPFISFSCLSALGSNSSTLLNKTGNNGHIVFFPIIRTVIAMFTILTVVIISWYIHMSTYHSIYFKYM